MRRAGIADNLILFGIKTQCQKTKNVATLNFVIKFSLSGGQWLWLRGLGGNFPLHRSVVRIQSSA